MLKQELVPLQPPQCDVPPQRLSARSPPQQPSHVSRVVTVKERTVEPPAGDEIPVDVRVCMEERRMKPERISLESPSTGTGPGAPGHSVSRAGRYYELLPTAARSSTGVWILDKLLSLKTSILG